MTTVHLFDFNDTSTLTVAEQDDLTRHEQTIERGLNTFVEVGGALLAIRDGRLYRAQFGTFEDYCRERWNLSKPYATQMIQAAQVVGNLVAIATVLPANEAQTRPLTSLPPEVQREAWQKAVETMPEGEKMTAAHVQAVVDEITEKPREIRSENIHVSDDSYEWYTPEEYIEAARIVMGEIDLDPASSVEAQETVKAGAFYTKKDNGLIQIWFGRVWLNPPYCMPDVELFVNKAIEAYSTGEIEQIVILTNNATDTGWFHKLLSMAGVACLTKGRIKFWGPDGSPTAGARQGQVIFYLGDFQDHFVEEFKRFGALVRQL